MGDVQSLPVVGEVVTVVQSTAQVTAAVACALVGETEQGDKLLDKAGNSWKEYSEKNIIAGPIRSAIHLIDGNEEEALRVTKRYARSFENVVDSTPLLGHAKGVCHYIAGNEEHGDKCMLNATRASATLGIGIATGGVGGSAVAGALNGMGTGYVYDTTASLIKNEPVGYLQDIKNITDNKDSRWSAIGGLVGRAAGDLYSGYSGTSETLEGVVDGTPGIGHAKGVCHRVAGNKAHFNTCMREATKNTAKMGAQALKCFVVSDEPRKQSKSAQRRSNNSRYTPY